MRIGPMVLVAAAAALAVSRAWVAAAELPDQSLSDYKIGETISGDEVRKEDLEGRVVVIEYWGTG